VTESARDVIARVVWNQAHIDDRLADAILAALRSAGYDPEARYEQVGWAKSTRWPRTETPPPTDDGSWVPVFRQVDTPQGEADA
jgi:hypothetical protein